MSDQLTTTQAAQRLGCSRSAIRRAIEEGRLPAEKFGRDWLIDPRALAEIEEPQQFGRKRRGYVAD